MARFRYRMQNILDIKMKLEEQAKNEYAQSQARLNEEEDKKSHLVGRKNAYEDESRRLRQEIIDVRLINLNQQAIESMKYMIKAQDIVINKCKKDLEIKRQALTEIMQDRKMHEKLKEKAFERHLEEEKAAESKSIDELTSYVYGQKE